MIETSKIMEILQEELEDIMSSDSDFYGQYRIILTNEQQFVKEVDREANAIYLVVKFMSTSVNYGQIVMPITLNAVGEQNHIEVCQHLLLEFAQSYNLKEDITFTQDEITYIVKQIYTSPQVVTNFNEIFAGFRSLFYMSGTFLIGENSLPISSITCTAIDSTEINYELKLLSTAWEWSNQLDSQAYTGTNSRTVSRAKVSTLTLSVVVYLVNNDFFSKILGMAFDNTTISPKKNKSVFYFTIVLGDNVFTVTDMAFRLANAHGQQDVGNFPTISLVFTN